jgi:hypothetical protein
MARMSLSRRHLLAAAALVAVASATGTGGVGYHWWHQERAPSYRLLSADEAEILDALAEAVFPAGGTPALGGREAAISAYFDALLARLEPFQADLLRLALHSLDSLPLATHRAYFRELPTEAATALLAEWLSHPRAELRGVVQSFHLFVGMAYLSHPAIAPSLATHFGCGFGRTEPGTAPIAPGTAPLVTSDP